MGKAGYGLQGPLDKCGSVFTYVHEIASTVVLSRLQFCPHQSEERSDGHCPKQIGIATLFQVQARQQT